MASSTPRGSYRVPLFATPSASPVPLPFPQPHVSRDANGRGTVFQGRFTGPVFLDFLRRLIRQSDRKVFLIVDGHPVHRARKVKAWLEENTDRIELFYLPGYSPHLNPDEILNQDIKTNAVGRNRARTLPELMDNVRGFLRSRQRRPHVVCRYFLERHVRYAAA